MNLIRVENLIFDYPGKRALNSVNFAIPENSITALVGPNGAGKTTLMRCLAALERPQHGQINFDNFDVMEHPLECHKQVGYLSDFFGLYDELTVTQCLQFVANSYGVDNPEAAIKSTIESLELGPYTATKAADLSRGWRQRLGIAQAIIHQPKMLLLDEPASGLDPEARGKLAGLLLALQNKGMTIIVSSHILSELSEYSSHMLVLENGKMIDFSAINEGQESNQFAIHIADPHQKFEAILDASPDFILEKLVGQEAYGSFSGGATEQAAFLKNLLDEGLLICRFEQVSKDMQQVYLDIINTQKSDITSNQGEAK